MTSGRDASRETLDQRLAEARDSILFDGEKILAQEMGDQGQAIVLTQSRILIIKAGLAATGEMNGQKTAAYVFGDIEAVKLRKGPMGAVIHICTTIPQTPTPGNPPMNIFICGDPQKVKRSDAFADQIEAAMGKPVERIEPGGGNSKPAGQSPNQDDVQAQSEPEQEALCNETPVVEPMFAIPESDLEVEVEQVEESDESKPKKGGREAVSLADEMFAEMSAWTPPAPSAPIETPAPQAEGVQDSIIDSIPEMTTDRTEPVALEAAVQEQTEEELAQSESEPTEQFRPNPNLPRPLMKQHKTSSALALIGVLGLLVIAGLAVMAPLKKAQQAVPAIENVDVAALTSDSKLLQSKVGGVIEYKAEVETLLVSSNTSAARICSALRSGNAGSAAAVARNDASGEALGEIEALKTPSGLAAARGDIISGLFARKNAAAAVAGSMIDVSEIVRKFDEANKLINRGLGQVDAMQQELDKQISKRDSDHSK